MRRIRLEDGRIATLRPIRPDDAEALQAFHLRLSAETVYQRFFTALPRLPGDWAHALTHLDPDRQMALVATDGDGTLVGVARYAWDPAGGDAEVAVVVQDEWQVRGLGRHLLEAVLAHGAARGLRRFRAEVLADNARMLHLVDRVGRVVERSVAEGVVTLWFEPREATAGPAAPGAVPRAAGVQPVSGAGAGREPGRVPAGEGAMEATGDRVFERILVAVDGSDHSLDAARLAARLGRAVGARVTLLTVYHGPSTALGEPNYSAALGEALAGARSTVARAREAVRETGGDDPETEWLAGSPADAIVDAARAGRYDLVVVGSRGLGRLGSALLGSVSSAVAARAGRPVLVVGDRA